MRVYGLTNSTVTISSSDVQAALQHDLAPLGIDSGVLLSARLKFWLHKGNGKLSHRVVVVTPPSSTHLAERSDTEAILYYMKKNGMRLR